MISSGKIASEIEYLDLEQLQGIGKLKAIRIRINSDNPEATKEMAGNALTMN
ncbi:MAG: hypothetical protein WDN75_14775 [Bacteroidota bacterium]